MRESEELREIGMYSSFSQLAPPGENTSRTPKKNKLKISGHTSQLNSNANGGTGASKGMLSSSSLDDSRLGENTAIGTTAAAEGAEAAGLTMDSRSSTEEISSIPDVHSLDYSEFYRRSSDGSDNDFAGGIAIVSNKNGVYEL